MSSQLRDRIGMLSAMHRCARALAAAVLLLLTMAPLVAAAGPPFPAPVEDQAVYDTAGILTPATIDELESIIDAAEARSGVEMVVYTQVAPGIGEEQNFENARTLVNEWGIGRSGFDDGLVLMIGMEPDLVHGKVALFGGSGFLDGYASEGDLEAIVEEVFVPRALSGDLDGATLATIREVDGRITPGGEGRMEMKRTANAVLGLVAAPIALVGVLGLAWNKWRREGDDPELTDSPSILMAGPPAEMTPALATVMTQGRANQHTVNTVLAELAANGRISFHNLDRVREVKSDDDPDPLLDPAIEVRDGDFDDRKLGEPQLEAWDKLQRLAGGSGTLSRERLWKVNSTLGPVGGALEYQAVKIGWLARMPGPSITRMVAIGVGIAVVGIGIGIAGFLIPMSGLVLLAAALVIGGVGTAAFGTAMSQRTGAGAYVDAMLTAYRRTLRKTMEQAHSMGEVGRAAGDQQAGRHAGQGRRVGHGARPPRRGLLAPRARARGAAASHRIAGWRLLPVLARLDGIVRVGLVGGGCRWRRPDHGLGQRLLRLGHPRHRRHVRRARQRRVVTAVKLLIERWRRLLRRRGRWWRRRLRLLLTPHSPELKICVTVETT